ncbi:MAG TPA: c-type cytochrome [Gammaproteobacteria bacterium]|nr:c-type cytochrome [Gammaproteobacteria bacterium]
MSQQSNYFGLSVAVLIVVAVVVFAIMKVADVGLSGPDGDMSAEAINKRIEPVGELNTGEPKMAEGGGAAAPAGGGEAAPAGGAATEQVAQASEGGDQAGEGESGGGEAAGGGDGRSGKQVYNSTCVACHGTGASGAPKLGEKKAWAPRIEKGMDALMESAMNGVPGTAMMAKGTCNDCTKQEMQAAVEYMVEQSQ